MFLVIEECPDGIRTALCYMVNVGLNRVKWLCNKWWINAFIKKIILVESKKYSKYLILLLNRDCPDITIRTLQISKYLILLLNGKGYGREAFHAHFKISYITIKRVL